MQYAPLLRLFSTNYLLRLAIIYIAITRTYIFTFYQGFVFNK